VDADRSLAGAERALIDVDAAIAALRRRPDVAPLPVLIGGQSRGGVLALPMQAPIPTRSVVLSTS